MNDRTTRLLAALALGISTLALGMAVYTYASMKRFEKSMQGLGTTLERLLEPRPTEPSRYAKPPPSFDDPD